jgi:hypothetical protein
MNFLTFGRTALSGGLVGKPTQFHLKVGLVPPIVQIVFLDGFFSHLIKTLKISVEQTTNLITTAKK